MARQRLINIGSPLRRQVLGDPAVSLRSTRRHRHTDRRLPWILISDVIGSTAGTATSIARLTFWRGDLTQAEVLDGDPAALPAAVVARLRELDRIKEVVAQAQGASHAA